MKTYDRVKKILENIPETRNSDKLLIWEFYKDSGKVQEVETMFGFRVEAIEKSTFLSKLTESTESIRRSRATIQSKIKELRPTNPNVIRKRRMKENTKGTFVYRENLRKGIWK